MWFCIVMLACIFAILTAVIVALNPKSKTCKINLSLSKSINFEINTNEKSTPSDQE
ncbi:hypothetical protein [Clostridium beijerinckii]|jgi:hypothetical protein|uniref:hypothetical protein n=1 Tax=Clostridium beijerinckii TaxID=1520 RepID=UPI0013614720|nr:hypothetical protein [Clostridium beijerinckii]MZK51889.1 hypothetical protein [Clostridium beijerinckii]MZK58506.1 hypothetical protein [Clostridium beijerinckii]MZK68854.1 hypothetical protein [Clostridium beijerinckii]MZK74225.1 hypothetical protein [Clostridium beijerinckii]MZK83926.1 hypothetical protein [Clostridium beijerinckii]